MEVVDPISLDVSFGIIRNMVRIFRDVGGLSDVRGPEIEPTEKMGPSGG